MIYVPFAFRFEAFGSIKIDESDVTEYLFWSKRHHIPWKDIKDIGCGIHLAGFRHYSFVYFSVEPLTVEEMHKMFR